MKWRQGGTSKKGKMGGGRSGGNARPGWGRRSKKGGGFFMAVKGGKGGRSGGVSGKFGGEEGGPERGFWDLGEGGAGPPLERGEKVSARGGGGDCAQNKRGIFFIFFLFN